MILASSLNLDKTDALVNLADDLAVFVRQAAQEGADLDTVERGAFARVTNPAVLRSISFWMLRETATSALTSPTKMASSPQ